MPAILEALPNYYQPTMASSHEGVQQDNSTLINILRDEMLWTDSDNEGALVKHALTVARAIGDRELIDTDKSGRIEGLLEETAEQSLPKVGTYGEGVTRGGGASYNESSQRVTIAPSEFTSMTKAFEKTAEKAGISFRNESDPKLFSLLLLAGHEAGHSMLGGVSRLINTDRFGRYVGEAGVRAYLAQHPEKGVTGNWETDVAIFEERVAEGYGQMVTKAAMETAGYTKTEIKKLAAAGALHMDVHGEHGTNQIDHLQHAHPKAGPHAFLPEDAPDSAKEPGQLGYAMPFSTKEIASTVGELHTITREPHHTIQIGVDPAEWHRDVSKKRSLRTRLFLSEITRDREYALNPQAYERKRIKRVAQVVGAVALTIFSPLAADHSHEAPSTPPSVVIETPHETTPPLPAGGAEQTPRGYSRHTDTPVDASPTSAAPATFGNSNLRVIPSS